MALGTWPEERLQGYNLYTHDPYSISLDMAIIDTSLSLTLWPHLDKNERKIAGDHVENCRNFLVDYLLAACLGEARHAKAKSNAFAPLGRRIIKNFYILHGAIQGNREGTGRSLWEYFRGKKYTHKRLFLNLEELFSSYRWKDGYGSPKWGFIAHYGYKLASAKGILEISIVLDEIMHLAHCGNNLFSSPKFRWCSINRGRLWQFLEWKRHAYPCCWCHDKYIQLSVRPRSKVLSIWHHLEKSVIAHKAHHELGLMAGSTPDPHNEMNCYIIESKRDIFYFYAKHLVSQIGKRPMRSLRWHMRQMMYDCYLYIDVINQLRKEGINVSPLI